jgi:GTP-binding protein Era
LIGAPNAGKSTLINLLVGQKVSIVSPKAQTTRNTIKGIFIEGDTQIVFLDTPGIFIPRKNLILERIIVKSAWQAIKEADEICFLIDAGGGFSTNIEKIIIDLKNHKINPTIIINKIDTVKKHKLLEIIAKLSAHGFEKIFMISALNGDGIEDLKKYLLSIVRPGPWAFDGENISDAPMKFMASEITREKLFLKLFQDLPYSLCVKSDSWENLKNGDVKIHQTIYVLKESQKMIVIGNKGSMIKEIGELARKDIAEVLGCKVHLFLFVKVKEDWMNEAENLGYV